MKLDIIIKFGFHALLAGPGTALGLVRATVIFFVARLLFVVYLVD